MIPAETCVIMLLHLLIHHESYFKGAKLFQPRTWKLLFVPGFQAGRAFLECPQFGHYVAAPAFLREATQVSVVAPPKDMEGEDPAAPPSAPYKSSAPYRNISNASLGFVSLIRVVKLTPLNNNLNVGLVCLPSKSQTRCKLPWLKSELAIKSNVM